MIGDGAVIPYILLCMLDRLWDVADAPYYPFLARLMPVEFASTLNGACIK